MQIRQIIDILENKQNAFDGIVYHGSNNNFSALKMNMKRGIYFSGDEQYAKQYGNIIYKCRVKISNPCIFTENHANSDMEIDRKILIKNGYDGRIVQYDNGELDIIAFYLEQITIIDKMQ